MIRRIDWLFELLFIGVKFVILFSRRGRGGVVFGGGRREKG